ncbi:MULTISPECIES: helix-turn-helix domain-containing protein [unclassified Arcicella]|uniref:helix-turn-helix domain-containing protein n=1 Tax=unclassified Arcicella TaxID=2644986 RepID=UPI0028626B68|nr:MULTISPECIES: helix-turn-helix domain-containing protein [unclassified Arcicella]MDR6561834.1 AraC-like DNA-binding protein [Arcicella sp. BE51]MDR6813980.1 AraC-like DNA-binding protein [Arcicella sp. BE140]MDR6825313.1 AraC-like DNA-binding protein [Arcicella sp. BE139]
MLPFNTHHQEFDPPEELRDSIKCFWYDKIVSHQSNSSFEVVPDGYAEIIFYFGSPCSIAQNGVLLPLPSPFMIGLLNHPIVFHAEGGLQIIAIRCFPWSVFDLLGLSPSKDGIRIFEHPIAQLQATLGEFINADKIAEAIAHVKQYLLNIRSQIAIDSMLSKAGIAMSKANGTIPVSQVAEAAHATVRTLERNFKQSAGYTVKDVSGLMRFEQVRNHLWLYPDANLAGLAYELGYTDQSHLSREFKRYTGTTPSAFARKAKKDKELLGNDFVAFVQA